MITISSRTCKQTVLGTFSINQLKCIITRIKKKKKRRGERVITEKHEKAKKRKGMQENPMDILQPVAREGGNPLSCCAPSTVGEAGPFP